MRAKFDQFMLVSVALLVKSIFLIYQWLAVAMLPLSVIIVLSLIWSGFQGFPGAVLFVVLLSISAFRLYGYSRDTSQQNGTHGPLPKQLIEHFIAWIGTLKYFSTPLSVVEDPGSYRIKGSDIRTLLDDDVLQPGDILLRGYQGYVDGELIRRTGGAVGGGSYFSHAALYLGEVNGDEDRAAAADRLRIRDGAGWRKATEAEQDAVRNSPEYFQAGREMVAHSMARGVHLEDILTFLRCDYLVVLRLPEEIRIDAAGGELQPLFDSNDDASDSADIAVRLQQGQTVSRAEIVASARRGALRCIGVGYDFLFEECRSFHRFSCSEFVYFCFKGIHRYIGLRPKMHSFAGMFARRTISPPDIYSAATEGKLKIVWSNVQ